MTVEGIEDCFQKSVGQQHARRGDVDDSDASFCRDGFEEVLAVRRACGYSRPFAIRIARVQNVHRNIFLDCWQHRRGMQDFGAKVS